MSESIATPERQDQKPWEALIARAERAQEAREFVDLLMEAESHFEEIGSATEWYQVAYDIYTKGVRRSSEEAMAQAYDEDGRSDAETRRWLYGGK